MKKSNNIKKIEKLKLFLLMVIVVSFNSCYTQKDKRLLQESRSLPYYQPVDYSEYKIAVNDELVFRIITEDDEFVNLIGVGNATNNIISYRVYPDGTIDVPFIEKIKVAGKTIPEAELEIKRKFGEIILKSLQIKLTLKNKVYTVLGEGGNGIFPIYKDKLNIYQALAQSGRIALSGDRKHIKIVREEDGKPKILEFDIRPQSVIDSKYYYVYPNDIIYVQKESSSFYKSNSYFELIGLITSSISLFSTVYYYTKYK